MLTRAPVPTLAGHLLDFVYFLGLVCFLGGARSSRRSLLPLLKQSAEYHSLSATVRELSWLSYLCADFGLSIPLPIPLYCDNQAAIHITKNQVFHERTKHLEIDCHLVRDKFRAGFLVLIHVPTSQQLADVFTKALPGPRFLFLLSKLGLVDVHCIQLEGGYSDT